MPFAGFFPSAPWQPVHFDRKTVCPSATFVAGAVAAGAGAGFDGSTVVVDAGGAAAAAVVVVAAGAAVVDVAGAALCGATFFAGGAEDVVAEGVPGVVATLAGGAGATVSVAVGVGAVVPGVIVFVEAVVSVDAVETLVVPCEVSVVADSCLAQPATSAMRRIAAYFFMPEIISRRRQRLRWMYPFPRDTDVTGNPSRADERSTRTVIMT